MYKSTVNWLLKQGLTIATIIVNLTVAAIVTFSYLLAALIVISLGKL
jgi:hypothetical protein